MSQYTANTLDQRLAKREKRPVGHGSRAPAAVLSEPFWAVKLIHLPGKLAGVETPRH